MKGSAPFQIWALGSAPNEPWGQKGAELGAGMKGSASFVFWALHSASDCRPATVFHNLWIFLTSPFPLCILLILYHYQLSQASQIGFWGMYKPHNSATFHLFMNQTTKIFLFLRLLESSCKNPHSCKLCLKNQNRVTNQGCCSQHWSLENFKCLPSRHQSGVDEVKQLGYLVASKYFV